jgi:hypothetical protein
MFYYRHGFYYDKWGEGVNPPGVWNLEVVKRCIICFKIRPWICPRRPLLLNTLASQSHGTLYSRHGCVTYFADFTQGTARLVTEGIAVSSGGGAQHKQKKN